MTNASLLQVTSRPLVSGHGLVTGTLQADEIAAQSPSTPSDSGPHPPIAALPPATQGSGRDYHPQIPKMVFRFSRQRMIKGKEKWWRILWMEKLDLSELCLVPQSPPDRGGLNGAWRRPARSLRPFWTRPSSRRLRGRATSDRKITRESIGLRSWA